MSDNWVFFQILESACDQMSEAECRELGFTPSLMCSSCSQLSQFGLDVISEGCQSCCQEDTEEDGALVSKAVVKITDIMIGFQS